MNSTEGSSMPSSVPPIKLGSFPELRLRPALPLPLFQPEPWASAILVDELDATRCQSLSDGTYRHDRYLPSLLFEIDYRRQP
jgi:hypothetical protein